MRSSLFLTQAFSHNFKGETLELSVIIVYSNNNIQQACLLNLDNLTDQPL